MYKENIMTYVLGKNFNCQIKYFEVVPNDTKKKLILNNFNLMASRNDQASYLCDLIFVLPVTWLHNIQPEGEARVNEPTFKYIF